MVSMDYGTFDQIFYLAMLFFRFITRINFKWDCVLLWIIYTLVCIGIWTKLRICRLTTDPYRYSYRCFLPVWLSFMITWMLLSRNDLKVSHRKQDNSPSDVLLVISLMHFEC